MKDIDMVNVTHVIVTDERVYTAICYCRHCCKRTTYTFVPGE